ncbi:N4-gp56 family major capsid protein [Variovorax sp. J22R193]|uniref:N4-gp56 family major capsid protein n=1 Tax=Variovorax fucosicus TaxID=3053517 RepID=UPI002577880D|nr:N4-gp56 family major capsid protein [Variovorax sp. J22R193]MDM0042139.1 N4-gp56 family major capsid protein [Variovorax sp. J22R193]
MPFTTNLTGTAQVDDSLTTAFEKFVWIAYGQSNQTDQLISKKVEINAKNIQMPKYSRMATAVTPLVETDDLTSVALADTKVTFTPVEYGNAITITSLASLQTGGLVDAAAASLIGTNYGETMDQIAINAMDASTNTYVIGATAEGSVAAGQVASGAFLNVFYNKLARGNVPMINGRYVMMAHDDVIADLRADTAVGSWTDVVKYTGAQEVLANEVGMYKGFAVVRNNRSTYADQTGGGTVDLYSSYFLGANALGKATSKPGSIILTGPFDKANRFFNLAWYEVSHTQILDQTGIWVGKCASSVGTNAA